MDNVYQASGTGGDSVTWGTLSNGSGIEAFSVGTSGAGDTDVTLDFGTGDTQVASGSHTHSGYVQSSNVNAGWANISHGSNIAHGLGSAPTSITITPSASTYTFGSATALSGSAGFYVYLTCAGSHDVNWRAEIV